MVLGLWRRIGSAAATRVHAHQNGHVQPANIKGVMINTNIVDVKLLRGL